MHNLEEVRAVAVSRAQVEAFAQEYIKDFNGAAAARRLNPEKAKDAKFMAHRMLHRKDVMARIKELLEERYAVTPEKVKREYAAVAFSRVTDVMRWGLRRASQEEAADMFAAANGGQLPVDFGDPFPIVADLDALPDEVRAAIKTVVFDKDGNMRIELHDKMKGLDGLSKILRLFGDEEEAVGDDGTEAFGFDPFDPSDRRRVVEEFEAARVGRAVPRDASVGGGGAL